MAAPITITVEEPAPGWLVLRPADLSEFEEAMEIDRIPHLLEKTLRAWLIDRPRFRVRAALGFVEDGSTVALHVWGDPG